MATLTLRGIRKSYGAFEAIKGIDLDVADREFVVFVGPSGCGKSTLLRMIAGLEEISDGELAIDGRRVNEVGPADRGLAMVFQSYALYPHMSVRQNMGFALRMAGVPRVERDRKVEEAARILQLEPHLDRKPKELSGGQRQRVAIGRAIVRNPRIFLFDEPLSNLDAALRGQMRVELTRLHEELNATMVYVTHDQVEAMTLADKIVVLQAGRVEQIGAPLDLYHRPANLFVAGFIGSPRMNLLPATVVASDAGGVTVELAGGGPRIPLSARPGLTRPGQSVTLGIRPESLRPDAGGPLLGQVRLPERLGSLTLLHVTLAGGEAVVAQIEGGHPVRAHEPMSLAVDGSACHVFDDDGQALPAAEGHSLVVCRAMILVCGEALIDLFVGEDAGAAGLPVSAAAGGSPFNLAVGLARLGAPVGYLGSLSRDAFGGFLAARLSSEGVATERAKRSARPTPLAVVSTDPAGHPAYVFHAHDCADRDLTRADLPAALGPEVEALAMGSYALAIEPIGSALLELAERESASRVISLDPNLRPALTGDLERWRARFDRFLRTAAIVKLSLEDLEAAYGTGTSPEAWARRWLGMGPDLVVLTLGQGGATAWSERGAVAHPGQEIEVADAVGAGDTFHAAMLARLRQRGLLDREALAAIEPEALHDVLHYGTVAAGITCTRRGADLPRAAEVEAALTGAAG